MEDEAVVACLLPVMLSPVSSWMAVMVPCWLPSLKLSSLCCFAEMVVDSVEAVLFVVKHFATKNNTRLIHTVQCELTSWYFLSR